MSEEGNKETKSSKGDSEFIINRGDEKIFGPGKDKEAVGYKNWLANEKEIENIRNKRLQGIIRQLNKLNPQKLTSDFLLGRYAYLQNEFSDIDDFLSKIYLQVEGLQDRESKGGVLPEGLNIESLIDKMSRGQKNLLGAIKSQQITFEQFLNLSQKQTENLADSLKRVSPKEERERWVDVEYRQEFYTRFTPSLEPRFYTELSEKERRLFDARWQLARAAYFKKATAAFPEKMIENQDLILFGMEQMEKLYEMPGVRQALEWYAQKIVSDKSFWDCKNELGLEQVRREMREFIKKNTEEIKKEKNKDEQDRLAKEADSVAWNWIWVSNLVESVDSRYSKSASGGRHNGLPGVLVSDDLRAVFHPQEKFENKCTKRQEWGAFGKWGVAQMSIIENKINFNINNNVFEFKSFSSPDQFWSARRTGDKIMIDGKEKEIIEVFTPECYPTVSMKSFWEEISFENNQGRKMSLLDFLLTNKKINWREIPSAFWVDYIPIKLNKAVKLLEYFKGRETRMEVGKPGFVKQWADPLIDVYTRLKLEKMLPGESEAFHNLKIWAVYASVDGVADTERKQPSLNLPFEMRNIVHRALKDKNVKYLNRDEAFGIK